MCLPVLTLQPLASSGYQHLSSLSTPHPFLAFELVLQNLEILPETLSQYTLNS